MQRRKRLKFFCCKCRLLQISSKANDDTVATYGERVEIKNSFGYLSDRSNSHDNNSDLCKDRLGIAVDSSKEIISLRKEVNFGKNQLSNTVSRPLSGIVYNSLA